MLARQPGVAERWQTTGVLPPSAPSRSRPTVSAARSEPPRRSRATYRLASLDNQGIDITGSVTRNPIAQAPPRYQAADFPEVDRTLKGDRLVKFAARAGSARRRRGPRSKIRDIQCLGDGRQDRRRVRADRPPLDPELQAALSAPPLPQYDVSMSLEAQPLDDLKVAPDARAAPLESPRRRAMDFR